MKKFSVKPFLVGAILFAGLSAQTSLAGTLLVTNVLSNSVALFDETSLQLIKELRAGFMPHEVAVTPNGKFALISNFGTIVNFIPGSTLTLIDIENGKVAQTINLQLGSRPHGIHFISDKEALVTAQGIQSLLVVDIVAGKVTKTLALPGVGAHMVIADAESHYAYVANVDSGTVTKIDLKSFSVVGEVKIGKEAEGMSLTSDQNLLLVTNRKEDFVAVIRTKDLAFLKKIKTGCGPIRVVMFDNGKSAVVTNSVGGTAQTIDVVANLDVSRTMNTNLSMSPLPVPINVAIRADQTTGFITNSFAGNITLVDFENGKILKTFKAARMPDGIAISPVNVAK